MRGSPSLRSCLSQRPPYFPSCSPINPCGITRMCLFRVLQTMYAARFLTIEYCILTFSFSPRQHHFKYRTTAILLPLYCTPMRCESTHICSTLISSRAQAIESNEIDLLEGETVSEIEQVDEGCDQLLYLPQELRLIFCKQMVARYNFCWASWTVSR